MERKRTQPGCRLLVLFFPFSLLAQPAITSFTAACSSSAQPGSQVTCPAGNNIILAWNVTGATGLSIDHGIGAVSPLTTGKLVVQPFNTAAITYTLTATGGSTATASVTINIVDDYALVSKWPSVVRAYGFDTSIPCNANLSGADPVYSPASPNAGGDGTCNNQGLDTARAVSGTGSWRMSVPGIAGQDPNGTLTLNFSADGSKSFGPGQEFYLQWRQYMDTAYVTNVYQAGGRCNANITLSGVTGSFSPGDTVVASGVPASGKVVSWNPETGVLVMIPQNQVSWLAGATIKSASGATGTIAKNNGGGTNCPGDNNATGMKQLMIDPEDQPPLPKTSSAGVAPNCIANHIVLTESQQQYGVMYMGCSQIAGEYQYEGFKPRYFSGVMPQSLLQSAVGCNYTANPTIGKPAVPPCVLYSRDEWMTMQLHVKIGSWYQLSQPGYPKATATFSGGKLTQINIADPGRDWAPGSTIILSAAVGSWVLAHQAYPNDTAVASCPVNNYGQIPSCTITNPGGGHYRDGTFAIRWPAHGGGNYRRDSTIERWQAAPGQPSVLVESMPFYDLVNNAPIPNDWAQGSSLIAGDAPQFPVAPANYGKAWFTNYSTGRDANGGPYPVANTWIDNFLVGTKRFPDPGVDVQPPTNLAIAKSAYPSITLTWEHNPDSQGKFNETGFDVERCPGQMYDCIAGHTLVSGAAWTTVASNVGAGNFTYTEKLPKPSQIYTYRVRAVGTNKSDWSSPVTTAVHPPSDLTAQWSGNQVKLSWIQRDETGQFAVERCAGVFQLRRINSFQGHAVDDPTCMKTGSDLPGSLPPGTVPFTEIARNIPGSANGATITWTDATATPGVAYSYRVRAYSQAGSWRNWNAGNGAYVAYTAVAIPASEAAPANAGQGK